MNHHNDTNDQTELLTYAQAIPLLVRELQLTLSKLRFIKAPQASDYFTTIANDAPYSSDMLIAHLNGLPLSSALNPAAWMQRSDFTILLWHALTGIHAQLFALHATEAEPKQSIHRQDAHTAHRSPKSNAAESAAHGQHFNNSDNAEHLPNSDTLQHSTSIDDSNRDELLQNVEHSDNVAQFEHATYHIWQQMIQSGITELRQNDDFRAAEPITYAEALAMLTRAQALINRDGAARSEDEFF
ncbi:hypothetical protein [Paenibacillus campi]|uniref:hypothetical protein n=1 Tax=Paenibacillus campi TaxID=3106031 RepID=UPI002AFE2202|nr:hypothetical protein [Paenibacillus sp. SGZ-1014]